MNEFNFIGGSYDSMLQDEESYLLTNSHGTYNEEEVDEPEEEAP